MNKPAHWTARSTEDFLYSIASDFIEDLKERMRVLPMNQSELAEAANVHKSFVSRIFKDPGNLQLETIVRFARTVGMKVSIVAHEDKNDPNNERGPIDPSVFRRCWEEKGQPADLWAFQVKPTPPSVVTLADFGKWGALFGLNRGIGNRAVAVGNSATTTATETTMSDYKLQDVKKQTSDQEVIANA